MIKNIKNRRYKLKLSQNKITYPDPKNLEQQGHQPVAEEKVKTRNWADLRDGDGFKDFFWRALPNYQMIGFIR